MVWLPCSPSECLDEFDFRDGRINHPQPKSMDMKSLITFLVPLLVSAGTLRTANAALVSFDDFSTGSDYTLIPNGYGGLQWYNFGAFNGLARPVTEGYRTGTISPSNVGFNLGGMPASS